MIPPWWPSSSRTVTRAAPLYNSGGEVYDIASNGTDVALVGGYACSSPDAGASTTQGVLFGEGFVQVVRP